uniref:hypothetical protein n=1 Tax=Flavobacterium sp. TaxID=239 RepID=UPI00404AEC7C
MQTQKVQDCIQYAINNVTIRKALKEREDHKDYWLSSIHAKIINRRQTNTHNQMIVRVGFDFAQRYENFEVKEDIIV